jgi:hypothetical protein
MNREVHVRFCERFRGEIPLYLLDVCPEQNDIGRWSFDAVNKMEEGLPLAMCRQASKPPHGADWVTMRY